MSDAGERALAFLRALERLPPYTGIVYHGLPAVPALARARWTRGVVATSRDPRIATENFTAPVIAAIVSRSGRDIAAFSSHPQEHEVVIPPEVPIQEVARTVAPDGRVVVIIEQLAEVDPDSGLPPTLDGLIHAVDEQLREAHSRAAVEITTPAKFVEQLYFADAP
jgi:hypothetical protein